MINISFANPYLLLLIIPLLLAVLIPFFIAIRKVNRSKETVFALICHILIVILVVLAAAGMMNTTVITETELYVVADVSHSSSNKLDLIDSYIGELSEQLPRNSKMGVIAFGKDQKVLVSPGEELTSVKNSGIDASATDIASALRFAKSKYSGSTIKHLVLYTDGMSTDPDAGGELLKAVEELVEANIYINVVYIDSNLSEDISEVQISDVQFDPSTYIGRESAANVLIESNKPEEVIVKLTKDGESFYEKTAKLEKGFNIVNFNLHTVEESGEWGYDYNVTVYPRNDSSKFNNSFIFSQKVNGKKQVLHITDLESEVEYVKSVYGDTAVIDSYVKPKQPTVFGQTPKPFNVPYTVEDLCKYDEIVLTSVDISGIQNSKNFIKSLDTVVSVFGKTLFTAGNNKIQNSEDEAVIALGNMLPVKFGNRDGDPKLYTIVIDSSRSMQFRNFDYFTMAKDAGCYLLDLLEEGDYFAIYHFSGETYTLYTPTEVNEKNVAEAKEKIKALEVTQGTMIGRALENVFREIEKEPYDDKKVMLISDGMSFEGGEVLTDDPVGAALTLKANNMILSAINTGNPEEDGINNLKNISSAGGGKYYFAKSSDELPGVMFDEIADDVTETEITGDIPIIVNRKNDDVLEGVEELPNISGYYYARPKASSENVLYVDFMKASGAVVKVPLYAYWDYGDGKVATLTTDIGGAYVSDWSEGAGFKFLENITVTATPDTRIDYPYTIETEFDGKNTHIEIVPAVVNPDASMTVKITLPDGSEKEQLLTFDSYRYFYTFETRETGKYKISITYDWITKSYGSETVFNIAYSPEYNSFESFTPASIHSFVRNSGNIFDKSNATLGFDETKLERYVVKFTVPFLTAAAILYIIDTVIRKLKWADIKSFFKKKKEASK